MAYGIAGLICSCYWVSRERANVKPCFEPACHAGGQITASRCQRISTTADDAGGFGTKGVSIRSGAHCHLERLTEGRALLKSGLCQVWLHRHPLLLHSRSQERPHLPRRRHLHPRQVWLSVWRGLHKRRSSLLLLVRCSRVQRPQSTRGAG